MPRNVLKITERQGRAHPRGMAGKPAWNRGLSWEQMFGEAEAERMRHVGRANIRIAQERLRSSPETENARRTKLSAIARRRGKRTAETSSGSTSKMTVHLGRVAES